GPTPVRWSRRTVASTSSAERSCSVAARLPMTTCWTCSTRRVAAARTVTGTRKLCGLERLHGGWLARRAPADRACRRERDGEAHERGEPVEREHDGVLLAKRERGERALEEKDECDDHQ